jgi:hypothetical protein
MAAQAAASIMSSDYSTEATASSIGSKTEAARRLGKCTASRGRLVAENVAGRRWCCHLEQPPNDSTTRGLPLGCAWQKYTKS